MSIEIEFGEDLVNATLNRVLRVYTAVLTNPEHPLRNNDTLGPILDALETADESYLLQLIDHSCVMLLNCALNHFVDFKSSRSGYSLELNVIDENGNSGSILDVFDEPSFQLVGERGWVEEFAETPWKV